MDTGFQDIKQYIENSIKWREDRLVELLKLVVSSKSEKFEPLVVELANNIYTMKQEILGHVDLLSSRYLYTIKELNNKIAKLNKKKK